jgi:hypothetical protein
VIAGLAGFGPVSRDLLRRSTLFRELPSDVVLGQARPERSDEFLSFTPSILSLSTLARPLRAELALNPLYGFGVPLRADLAAAPGHGWSALLRPHAWPSFAFPGARSYAVSLALLQVLILFTSYVLLRLAGLHRASPLLFTAALLTLAWSPHLQRWLVSGIGLAYAYLGFWVAAAHKFLSARHRGTLAAWAVALAWSAAAYTRTFYPPALYTFAWVGIAALAFRHSLRSLRAALALAVVAAGVGLLSFTELPGLLADLHLTGLESRSYAGGDFPPQLFRNLLWPGWGQAFGACDDAMILVGPALLALLLPLGRMKPDSHPAHRQRLLVPGCVLIGMLAWMTLPLSAHAAHGVLLDRVAPRRMGVGFSALLGLLLFVELARYEIPEHGWRRMTMAMLLVAQIIAVTHRGLLWNPIARVSQQQSLTPALKALRSDARGGMVLAHANFAFGANLGAVGIRQLTGRFDSPAPELTAFLLGNASASIAPKTSAAELRALLFPIFYLAWDPALRRSRAESDVAWYALDACAPELGRAGVSAIVVDRQNAAVIQRACPTLVRARDLPGAPDATLLERRDVQPPVHLVDAPGRSPPVVSDEPAYALSSEEAPSVSRRITVAMPAGKEFIYTYDWTGRGLEVHWDSPLPAGTWYFETAMESRFLQESLRSQSETCRALRDPALKESAVWVRSAREFLREARECAFKRVAVVDGAREALFATVRR